MPDVRLIALDLDGTLLNSRKELTVRTKRAIESAAGAGIEIVPATGRFYRGMPGVIRELPFVRYVITINGAQVLDLRSGETIYSAEIPPEDAVALYEYMDTLPVLYDAYIDGWGYMTQYMQERVEEFGMLPFQLVMMRELRSPVPDLKEFIRAGGRKVQKMQLFTPDTSLRAELLKTLPQRFPQYAISASLPNNIEINSFDADKGVALRELAKHVGADLSQTMAFGDGLNDLTMLLSAGMGVAMGNAHPDVKAAADAVVSDCDSDGVAQMIEKVLVEGKS